MKLDGLGYLDQNALVHYVIRRRATNRPTV